MGAVFPRTGYFLCSEHKDVMVFYKSNRCPLCIEKEEYETKVIKVRELELELNKYKILNSIQEY